jgi:hypothetical protein
MLLKMAKKKRLIPDAAQRQIDRRRARRVGRQPLSPHHFRVNSTRNRREHLRRSLSQPTRYCYALPIETRRERADADPIGVAIL